MSYLEQSSMNAKEEEEKKMNETFSSFDHPLLLYIYVCTEEEKCQLCALDFNVCSRRSNE